MHSPNLTTEMRELEPTPDGWRRFEHTGRACLVCTCGHVSGFIDTADARAQFAEHTEPREEQRVVLDITGVDIDMTSLIRQQARRGDA